MQPAHTRLICRAHNRYIPSVALWQYFALSSPPTLHRQRLLSTATDVAQAGTGASPNNEHVKETLKEPGEANGSQQAKNEGGHATAKPSGEPAKEPETEPPQKLKLRTTTTNKGQFEDTKVKASIRKNIQAQKASRRASITKPQELLAKVRRAYNESRDYEGVVVMPMVPTTSIKESSLPWCVGRERMSSGMDRLDLEIDKFYKYSRPTQHEQTARRHVIEQVRAEVLANFPSYNIEVFGSQITGLALPTSDIDFRLRSERQVTDPKLAIWPPPEDERRKCMATLNQLFHNVFKKKGKKERYFLAAIRHARYPLIAAQDKPSGLDIQIVLANDTSLSRDLMVKYMAEIPYLEKLYCVIKNILNVRGLSDVFRGGFGSYSLFMMVVASIKHMPHPRNDAAGALFNFLQFWAEFDTKTNGVSIEPVELFDKEKFPVITDTARCKIKAGEIKPLPGYMLCLRDPADETNDLGRKGIAIKHVQATFAHLHNTLMRDVKSNTRHSLLTTLVGTSYMLYLPRREKLQEYGKRLSEQMRISLAKTAKAIREADQFEKEEQEVATHAEDGGTSRRMAENGQNEGLQGPTDEMNQVLQTEVQKMTVSEYSDTTPPSLATSTLGAVADGSQSQGAPENATAQQENNVKGP